MQKRFKMDRPSNPILILGESLTALGMAGTFGKRGIDVYLFIDKRSPAAFSKYVKKELKFRTWNTNLID